ncbi:MAG: serine/threonine-protein phosphatase [Lachnospiraceae bacterium]|nr:serine/threonine-protein phosphatase [Lachnospiraceae bacterium]
MNFKAVAHSDVGIRKKTNQDSAIVKIARTDYGKVAMASVCDGMGGLANGELASATVIRMLSKWFETTFPALLYQGLDMEILQKSWTDLIYEANGKLAEYGRAMHADMGTTMVLLLIVDHVYYIANVGDSRAYYMRDYMQQITKDQTYVQREMDLGHMTYEQARRDPQRNVLLQCIGASPIIEPDFYTGNVDPGSAFLLCSDGFRHTITQEEIYEYLNPLKLFNENTMQEGVNYLTELNKYRQETDNISAVLIRAD